MRSAAMTSRLLVWMPASDKDQFGAKQKKWTPYNKGKAIFAERRKMGGSLTLEGRELFADYQAEYYVYIQHKIKVGWKVFDTETEISYRVETIFPDKPNNMLRLVCKRINE